MVEYCENIILFICCVAWNSLFLFQSLCLSFYNFIRVARKQILYCNKWIIICLMLRCKKELWEWWTVFLEMMCGRGGLPLTSCWLCAGAVVVLVLMSQMVGTESKLSALMKDWASAYSDNESAGEENNEFVERSSMQDRSWKQKMEGRGDVWWLLGKI